MTFTWAAAWWEHAALDRQANPDNHYQVQILAAPLGGMMKREHSDLMDEILCALACMRDGKPGDEIGDYDIAADILPDLLAAVPTEYRRIPWLAFLLNADVIDADLVELWWKAEGNALERRLAQAYGVEVE